MQETAESISSLDRRVRGRLRHRLGGNGRASTESSVRALAVVVIDEDAQDPVEVAGSENQ